MTSEWMKVMLGEIERKKAEAEQARIEEEQRERDRRGAAGPCARPAPTGSEPPAGG